MWPWVSWLGNASRCGKLTRRNGSGLEGQGWEGGREDLQEGGKLALAVPGVCAVLKKWRKRGKTGHCRWFATQLE